MSGEYYGMEEGHTKFCKDYETSQQSNRDKYGQDHNFNAHETAPQYSNREKYGQDQNFNNIEEELEIAESRCNILKDRLDYMKEVYGVKRVIGSAKSKKVSNLATNPNHSDCSLPHPEVMELGPIPDQKTEDELLKSSEEDQAEPQPKKVRVNFSGAARKRYNYLLKHGLSHEEARQQASKDKGSKTVRSEESTPEHQRKKGVHAADENISLTSSNASVDAAGSAHQKSQKSPTVATDNTGAAVRTINSILNGITNSVNRLSDLHLQLSDTSRGKFMAALTPHRYLNDMPIETPGTCTSEVRTRNVDDLHISEGNIKNMHDNKTRYKRKKITDPKIIRRKGSLPFVKKTIKVDKNSKEGTRMLGTRQSTINAIEQENLVEIFHNNEAKSSESDVGNKAKHVNCAGDYARNQCITDSLVPVLQLPGAEERNDMCLPSKTMNKTFIQDKFFAPQGAQKNFSEKSYLSPTIASRMKQVAKSYLNNFSFKTMANRIVSGHERMMIGPMIRTKKAIPFCSATSATPSHNIGINIQQVMNIFKNRQPIDGISPTLAHNIGLAAERLNTPLLTFSSSVNSKTGYMRHQQCPLSKSHLNYQQLQDVAKSIPEETIEEIEEDEAPDIKTVIITGPSGDMAVKNKNVPSWTADGPKGRECTCVPNTGSDINYVASRVKKYNYMLPSQTLQKPVASKCNTNHMLSKRNHQVLPTKLVKGATVIQPKEERMEKHHHISDAHSPLVGKDKNLKEVLIHLHDEFQQLNLRYEELSKKPAPSGEETREIEKLEDNLNKKEEEITMVMSLCKEVMALKNQIKYLKKVSSSGSLEAKQGSLTSPNYNNYNNPQAAFHLTKLLKQIQTYQSRYKNEVTTPKNPF